MADSGFLQAALELLGRPGNAVRGALIDGPGGFGQGLTGSRQYDPTELPGINQLPDEGPSLGPLHLTPRTVAGFGASTVLDPLNYVGPGAIHGLSRLGEGLLHPATAALEHGLGEGALDLSVRPFSGDLGMAGQPAGVVADKMGEGAQRLAAQSAARRGYAGDPMTDPIEQLLEHANGIAPGHELVSSDGAPMRDLPAPGTPLSANIAPDAEATPLGDQKYAQAKDRLGQTQAQLGELNGRAIPARQWLTETSKGNIDSTAQSWEDVVGVPRGTPVENMRPDNTTVVNGKVKGGESDFAGRGTGPDMSQGPGLTSKYNDETVGFSRQEVMSHLANLEQQIQQLTHTLSGDKGSRFGDPLERRGMENTLSDWQARRQLQADPSLADTEKANSRRSYEDWAAENGKTPRPGLSDKQTQVAQNKTAQQLSRDESFRRAPDSQYFNKGTPESAPDEANMDLSQRGDNHAPHGDPLEEERALRDQEDKFGRKGAGTYQNQDMLGHDDNYRPGGLRRMPAKGEMDQYESAQPNNVLTRYDRLRQSEPTAGLVDDTESRLGAELIGLRQATALRHARAAEPMTGATQANPYLAYLGRMLDLGQAH